MIRDEATRALNQLWAEESEKEEDVEVLVGDLNTIVVPSIGESMAVRLLRAKVVNGLGWNIATEDKNKIFVPEKDLAGPVMEHRGGQQGPPLAHIGQVAEVEVKVIVLVILVELLGFCPQMIKQLSSWSERAARRPGGSLSLAAEKWRDKNLWNMKQLFQALEHGGFWSGVATRRGEEVSSHQIHHRP